MVNLATASISSDETYNADYYASHCGLPYSRDVKEWSQLFGGFADKIIQSLHPKKVFDAGCAHGFLVEALRDRGVEAWGRDISHFAMTQARPDIQPFVSQGSVSDPIEDAFDLITCIEVLEHMEEAEALASIASMAAAASRILFSSSPSDFEEPTHINVKPVGWWLARFAEAGMMPVYDYDASFITSHAFLVERSSESINYRAINIYATLIEQRITARENDHFRQHELERMRQQEAASASLAGAAMAELARLEEMTVHHNHNGQAELNLLRAEYTRVINSTCWRAMKPVRRLGDILPPSMKRATRRTLKAGYWMSTLQYRRLWNAWQAKQGKSLHAHLKPANSYQNSTESTNEYTRWVNECDTLTDNDRLEIRDHIVRLKYKPLISVVMPAYNSSEKYLREAIASVQTQLYPHWELCIADDASPSDIVQRVISELARGDSRIKWIRRETNGHIAAASNTALSLASGEFIALMDHDDLIPEHALYEVAAELNDHPDTDLIYSDEDLIDANGQRSMGYFKPEWNIELQLGHNLFSHLGVYRRSLLTKIGGFREGIVDGSQDYDLILRCVAESQRIRHIPSILYHWRQHEITSSFSRTSLNKCIEAARRSIRDYLWNQGISAEILPAPLADWTRVRWPLPQQEPRVSVIIPTRDKADMLARCVSGILHRTNYSNLELIIVDNDSLEQPTLRLFERLKEDRRVRIIHSPGPFNYSLMNNQAVDQATGEILVLVNNDIEVIEGDWLREMVSLVIRPEVGAVGAKLLYPDGRIQHAGVGIGTGTLQLADHFGCKASRHEYGYFGQYTLTKEVSAVTGACLAVRKEVYLAAGGLDAQNLHVSFNDVDFCLRLRQQGYRNLWTPFAELYHLESISRGVDESPQQIKRLKREVKRMKSRWGDLMKDPFYNPNFDPTELTFQLAVPSRHLKRWRNKQS
jgi:glycosyltransferase involved in cell wall biosynthesis